MDVRRAMEAHFGGVELLQIRITLMWSRNCIRIQINTKVKCYIQIQTLICIKVKSWVRIRILFSVMGIHNPGVYCMYSKNEFFSIYNFYQRLIEQYLLSGLGY
jgi:hypothetical protein